MMAMFSTEEPLPDEDISIALGAKDFNQRPQQETE